MNSTLIIVPILLLVFACGRVLIMKNRRQNLMARLAWKLQLRFARGDHIHLENVIRNSYFNSIGHAGYLSNLIHGRLKERYVTACDYKYEIGTGQNRTLCHRTVVLAKHSKKMPEIIALRNEKLEPIGRFAHFRRLQTAESQLDTAFRLYSGQELRSEEIAGEDIGKILLECPACCEIRDEKVIFFSERLLPVGQVEELIKTADTLCKKLNEKA